MTFLVEPPTDFTTFELAEWIETSMLLSGLSTIASAEVEARFPVNQRPDGAEIDQLFGEIRARADNAPALYPFRALEGEIVLDEALDPTIYFFLLVLSIEGAPYRRENRFNEVSPALELVTREAMLGIMGKEGEARRFGWPNGDGRPENLGSAVEWLASEMNLEVGVVWDDVDEDDKDGGIDVAAWHPFPDKGPSFPAFLIQVTTQATYARKPGDVVPEQWIAWIRFGREPLVGLSVPFAIPPDAKVRLSKLRYTAGLLLDRLRLCKSLEDREMKAFPEYGFMAEWTQRELQKLVHALTERDPEKQPRLAKKRRPKKAAPVEHR